MMSKDAEMMDHYKEKTVTYSTSTDDCGCNHHDNWVCGPCSCFEDIDEPLPQVEILMYTLKQIRFKVELIDSQFRKLWKRLFRLKERHHLIITNVLNDDKLTYIRKKHRGYRISNRCQKHFWTGSTYVGQWNGLGMDGHGMYIMPHGVEYTGSIFDGRFHGYGILRYPSGFEMECIFDHGKMITWNMYFADGLKYDVPWKYCKMPDRRLYPEVMRGFKCSRNKPFVPNCYDTGDGCYDPNMKCVFSLQRSHKILRVVSKTEEEWIEQNCVVGRDTPIGYHPKLYEQFVTGAGDLDEKRTYSSQTLNSYDAKVYEYKDQTLLSRLMGIPPLISELRRSDVEEQPLVSFTDRNDDTDTTEKLLFVHETAPGERGDLTMAVSRVERHPSGSIKYFYEQVFQQQPQFETSILTETRLARSGSGQVNAAIVYKSSSQQMIDVIMADTKITSKGEVTVSGSRMKKKIDDTTQIEFSQTLDSSEISERRAADAFKRDTVQTKEQTTDLQLFTTSTAYGPETLAEIQMHTYDAQTDSQTDLFADGVADDDMSEHLGPMISQEDLTPGFGDNDVRLTDIHIGSFIGPFQATALTNITVKMDSGQKSVLRRTTKLDRKNLQTTVHTSTEYTTPKVSTAVNPDAQMLSFTEEMAGSATFNEVATQNEPQKVIETDAVSIRSNVATSQRDSYSVSLVAHYGDPAHEKSPAHNIEFLEVEVPKEAPSTEKIIDLKKKIFGDSSRT